MKHPNNPLASASDETLLARYTATRCEDAFAEFHRRHHDSVFRFIRKRVRSRHDAEDLTQETFLCVHRYHTKYDPSRPAKPWLLRIASNQVNRFYRNAGRTPDCESAHADIPDHRQTSPEDALVREETARALHRLIALLPDPEKQVAHDLIRSDRPHQQVALSSNALKYRRRHAIRLLRRMNDDNNYGLAT